ncbi:MAG: hypothetical protein C0412_07830 [Flavobacterium sp.]|nr:hypothetical protein [Flavobacterium sp.]
MGGFCYIILNLNLSNKRPTGFFLHRFRNIANIKLHFYSFSWSKFANYYLEIQIIIKKITIK